MSDEPMVDDSQLRLLSSLRGGKGAQMVSDLIDMFEKLVPETIEGLRRAIEAGHVEQVEHFAHKLKGSCANLGARRLRDMAQSMEGLARQKKLEGMAEQMSEVDRTYGLTLQYLREHWYRKDGVS